MSYQRQQQDTYQKHTVYEEAEDQYETSEGGGLSQRFLLLIALYIVVVAVCALFSPFLSAVLFALGFGSCMIWMSVNAVYAFVVGCRREVQMLDRRQPPPPNGPPMTIAGYPGGDRYSLWLIILIVVVATVLLTLIGVPPVPTISIALLVMFLATIISGLQA